LAHRARTVRLPGRHTLGAQATWAGRAGGSPAPQRLGKGRSPRALRTEQPPFVVLRSVCEWPREQNFKLPT
jgi:hypothetical protein